MPTTSLPPLPSLQALRILDATVRLKSFTAAARELGLSHGAVSRQIRQMEARTGLLLFRRNGPRMQPTDAAIALAVRAGHALRELGDAFERPGARASKHRLRLATTASFARHWLAPRLLDLQAQPDVRVAAVETGAEPVQLGADRTDVAIRYGAGAWAGAQTRRLGTERAVPVASPGLARHIAAGDAAAIASAPLIENTFLSWRAWLQAARLPASFALDLARETSDASFVRDAAAGGAGVALARMRLAERMIARGELVALSDVAVDDGYAYYLAWPPASKRLAAIDALAKWLDDEFARQSARLGLPAL
jgi:LysR family glycine cleavage system transcriptional activator